MGLGGSQSLTGNVTMVSNPNSYTFYGATPAEIATLSGIGSTALSTELTGKMELIGAQLLTGNVTMVSNPNN